jgi:hypothetical protein
MVALMCDGTCANVVIDISTRPRASSHSGCPHMYLLYRLDPFSLGWLRHMNSLSSFSVWFRWWVGWAP